MLFDITSKSVREFADRVVKMHPQFNKPLVLELASTGFGYRNFDTLSGVLKNASHKPEVRSTSFRLDKPVTLWVEGRVLDNEVATCDWVKVAVTETFVAHVLKRQALCVEQGLLHVSEDSSPADWDKSDESFNVVHDWQLYVSPSRVWFRGQPKHASFNVESRAVYIDDLLELLGSKTGGDEGFCWIEGALYKDGSSAMALFDSLRDVDEEEGDWVEPSGEEDALYRIGALEAQLVGDALGDDSRADILDEIGKLEDWLEEKGYDTRA